MTAPRVIPPASPAKHPAAVALGRLGGLASARIVSEAKQEASRRNGCLGGRPVGTKKPVT